ncbi:hypothetical protein [Tahibacter soli]|uniref:Uncharacterized protein n=1 Tax=Tahibacter soli TaxID=2983605 RepID=A0A9X3YFT9_9GAMM|nr:hypothetical protein [Tahibacter soli]MDC8011196.1 hypothetical protein [Tahibacter soli]
MNDDICEFIEATARTLAIFRKNADALREDSRFKNVTTALIPWTNTSSFTEQKTTSLNFTIDADLLRWTNINKKAVSACVVICCTEGRWRLECEYGWSGQEIGFDQVEDETIEYDTADSLVEDLEGRSIALLRSFEAFLADC